MLLQKRFKSLLIVLFSFLMLNTFTACDKDDDNVEPDKIVKSEEPEEDNTEQSDEDGNITLYSIEGIDINKLKDFKVASSLLDLQKDTKKHLEIWGLISKIVPTNYLTFFNEYLIFSGEGNGTAGYVVQTKDDLSKWQVGIAIDFAYQGGFNTDGELSYTIIHEFGHVLSLNDTQVNSKKTENDCQNYFPGEGCAKETSYINTLYQNYWKDIASEFQEIGDDESKKETFYSKYQDRFVTQYASTNPAEDFAEVFTHFVIFDKPTGDSNANQKVLLLYKYPELTDMRNSIRESLKIGTKSKSVRAIKVWKRGSTFGKKGQKR